MLPDEFEHLVKRDSRFLGRSSHRDLAPAEPIEGLVDLGFPEAPLDEPAEGLGTIRLQTIREAIDLTKAFLRETHGYRPGHVYSIIFRIQGPFGPAVSTADLLGML